MTTPIQATALSKIHLVGEHSVIYGHRALIASTQLKTHGAFQTRKDSQILFQDQRFDHEILKWDLNEVIHVAEKAEEDWRTSLEKDDFHRFHETLRKNNFEIFRKSAIGILFQHFKIKSGLSIHLTSDIPPGSGMGSSASFETCLVRGLAQIQKIPLTSQEIYDIAFRIEKLIHGRPSGGDNAVLAHGGIISFQKGLVEPVFISKPLQNFFAVHTGAPQKSTGEWVEHVKGLPSSQRDPNISSLGQIAEKMLHSLKIDDISTLQNLMSQAQLHLRSLGLSTPTIDQVVQISQDAGGVAKLCGAGGGGIVLCHHNHPDSLMRNLQAHGYHPIPLQIGSP